MDIDRDEKIRTRAYEIWEREGRPTGLEQEHWEQARREIEGERSGDLAPRTDTGKGVFPERDEGRPGLGGYGSDQDAGSVEYNGPEGRPGLGGYGMEDEKT